MSNIYTYIYTYIYIYIYIYIYVYVYLGAIIFLFIISAILMIIVSSVICKLSHASRIFLFFVFYQISIYYMSLVYFFFAQTRLTVRFFVTRLLIQL